MTAPAPATALITGAGGFVGAALARGLSRAGWRVVALDRGFDAETARRLDGIARVEADLLEPASLPGGRVDLVIHAAALTSPPAACGLSAPAHVRLNCDLLLAALDQALTRGARDFVFLSSSGVFGAGVPGPLTEEMPATATHSYALAKRVGELLLACAPELRTLAVRLGPIYGPHEAVRPSRLALSVLRRWVGTAAEGRDLPVASPLSRRDWTWSEDLAGALLALLARRPRLSGVVHLTSGEAVSDADLAGRIARRFGVAVAGRRDGMSESGGDGNQTEPPRQPMGSIRLDLPALFAWTPLATGLDRVMEAA